MRKVFLLVANTFESKLNVEIAPAVVNFCRFSLDNAIAPCDGDRFAPFVLDQSRALEAGLEIAASCTQ
jgi:hypothetical protein